MNRIWEYKFVSCKDQDLRESYFNSLGLHGWELVGFITDYTNVSMGGITQEHSVQAVFKRNMITKI